MLMYVVLAQLMLLASLSNAVCLHNASLFAIDLANSFFSCFVLVH